MKINDFLELSRLKLINSAISRHIRRDVEKRIVMLYVTVIAGIMNEKLIFIVLAILTACCLHTKAGQSTPHWFRQYTQSSTFDS